MVSRFCVGWGFDFVDPVGVGGEGGGRWCLLASGVFEHKTVRALAAVAVGGSGRSVLAEPAGR